MLQEIGIDSKQSQPELEIDAPQQVVKAAALTGAFVQRGRDRAPRLQAAPAEATSSEAASEPPLAAAAASKPAGLPARRSSRWSDVLFVAACCAAFFATFLFVLRF